MKYKSSIQRKQDQQRRATYTPAQRMSYVSCDCDAVNTPAQSTLDALADHKMTAGYDVRKANMCSIHHIALSVNKLCMMCEL